MGPLSKKDYLYLKGTITLEEYRRKKEGFINKKKKLQEVLKDFVTGVNKRTKTIVLSALLFLRSRECKHHGEAEWRRGWDLNPGTRYQVNCLAGNSVRPLRHLSLILII